MYKRTQKEMKVLEAMKVVEDDDYGLEAPSESITSIENLT